MTNERVRRDARHCPRCDARGILPLDQPQGAQGEIADPVMLCPVCEEEFRATGMKWLGAVRVDTSESEEEQAGQMEEWLLEVLGTPGEEHPTGYRAT